MSTSAPITHRRGFNIRALPILLVAVILAGAISYVAMAFIQLIWCGFQGCSQPSDIVLNTQNVTVTALACLTSGLAWLAAVWLPTWWRPGRVRFWIASGVALVGALAVLLIGTSFLFVFQLT